MSALTPFERSQLARIGVHTSWARTTDRSARTAPARAALEAKFLTEAEGDPVRAAALRKAYYARLALTSARARRQSREHIARAAAAEAELSALDDEGAA